MTPLEPVVSEAELTLLLLVFIAVMSIITTAAVLWTGVRQRIDRRRSAGPVEVVMKVDAKKFREGITRGQQAARDLAAYEQRRGGRR